MRFEGEEAPEQRYNTITLYSCTQTIDKKDLEIHLIYLEEKNCFFLFAAPISLLRFTGTIVGIGDLDFSRWPKSKWRCLKVLTSIFLVCAPVIVMPRDVDFDNFLEF